MQRERERGWTRKGDRWGWKESDRRRDREKRESRKGVWGKREERQSQNGERENVSDRQSKFEREEVTEERMQTKEEEG